MELRRYLQIIWQRKWVFLACLLLTPIITFIILEFELIKPTYMSQAKVMIKVNSLPPQFVRGVPAGVGEFQYINKENATGTIEEILQSVDVIKSVIKELDIRDKKGRPYAYDAFIDPGIFRLMRKHKGIGIDNVVDSEMFLITGYSDKAPEAEAISERALDKSLALFSELYKKESRKARKAITERMGEARKELSEAEARVAGFKMKNNIYNPSAQTTTYLQDISALESDLTRIERSYAEAVDSLEEIKKAVETQPAFKESALSAGKINIIEDYKRQTMNLEMSLAKVKTDLGAEHPDVKQIDNQIDSINRLIDKELASAYGTSENSGAGSKSPISKYGYAGVDLIKIQASKLVVLKKILDKKKLLNEIPDKEVELDKLALDVDTFKSTYSSLLSGLAAAENVEKMDIHNIMVIDRPADASLYFPEDDWTGYMVSAILTGFFIGLFVVFMQVYLAIKPESQRDAASSYPSTETPDKAE